MKRFEGRIFKEQDDATLSFYKRGGIVRSLYEASFDFKIKIEDTWKNVNTLELIDICEDFIKQGEQIKLAKKIDQTIYIFDRQIVYIPIINPNVPIYNRSDVIIKNENYANAMVEYFNSCWDKAETVEQFKNNQSIKG